MTILADLEKVLALSKQNKKTAVTNEKIADFNRQYKPTKENNRAWKEAKGARKNLENIRGDIKEEIRAVKRFDEDRSQKLAGRFERFLSEGKLGRANKIVNLAGKRDNINIAPYLSEDVSSLSSIDLNADFSDPQRTGQLLAQAGTGGVMGKYIRALTNPYEFIQDAQNTVNKLNRQTKYKEEFMQKRGNGMPSFQEWERQNYGGPQSLNRSFESDIARAAFDAPTTQPIQFNVGFG